MSVASRALFLVSLWAGPAFGQVTFPGPGSTGPFLADGSTLRGQCASLCSAGLVSSGSVTSSAAGQLIQCRSISGVVTVTHDGVVLRCSVIRSSGLTGLWIRGGSGTRVEDCVIDMLGASIGSEAIRVLNGATNLLLTRLEVVNMQDGIKIDEASQVTVSDSWIHDFRAPTSSENHWDGFELDGAASNILIIGNNVVNEHTDTSAVMIDNWGGPNADITVARNRLVGGGFTVYCDGNFNNNPLSRITYSFNSMGTGRWGYTLFRNCDVASFGNVDDVTGQLLPGQGSVPAAPASPTTFRVLN